jgi:hypothetical protein
MDALRDLDRAGKKSETDRRDPAPEGNSGLQEREIAINRKTFSERKAMGFLSRRRLLFIRGPIICG